MTYPTLQAAIKAKSNVLNQQYASQDMACPPCIYALARDIVASNTSSDLLTVSQAQSLVSNRDGCITVWVTTWDQFQAATTFEQVDAITWTWPTP